MIFSENRYPPRTKSGAGFFRIMLWALSCHQERVGATRLSGASVRRSLHNAVSFAIVHCSERACECAAPPRKRGPMGPLSEGSVANRFLLLAPMTMPVAMPRRRHDNARSAVIVVIAIRVAVIGSAHLDAHAARSRIDADLRHRGGCYGEECRCGNDAECEFSHKSLLSLLKQINAEACDIVPRP